MGTCMIVLGLVLLVGCFVTWLSGPRSAVTAMLFCGLLFGGLGVVYRLQAVRSFAVIEDKASVLTNWRGVKTHIALVDVLEVERVPYHDADRYWIYLKNGKRIGLAGEFENKE